MKIHKILFEREAVLVGKEGIYLIIAKTEDHIVTKQDLVEAIRKAVRKWASDKWTSNDFIISDLMARIDEISPYLKAEGVELFWDRPEDRLDYYTNLI
jgi:hypothetical protein